ncbi:unknown [Bacteroides finegoldii CAG:203]|nr:unknown [Bacteroides finegoldii CAG:203]
MTEEYILPCPRKRFTKSKKKNVKVTLLYLIILTLLQKQISLRMGRCIQSLNIGVKISLCQCQ